MAINKKLIHFKNKQNFEREVANNNILDTSICFIQDSKEIYTHGTLYDCSTIDFKDSLNDYIDSSTISFNSNDKLQLGKDIIWQNTGETSDMNDFVESGVYNLSGEHTRSNDNLPIMNTGSGHTFQGCLLVYDSSLPNTGNAGNDCCITQVLTLSNRVGGDSNTYIRTGLGKTTSELTWGAWGKMQTNVEVGQVYSWDLDKLIDNGMYSGVAQILNNPVSENPILIYDGVPYVYANRALIGSMSSSYYANVYHASVSSVTYKNILVRDNQYNVGDSCVICRGIDGSDPADPQTKIMGVDVQIHYNPKANVALTFVLITVNNYAAATQLGTNTQCTQLLYGIDVSGTVVLNKRIGTKTNNIWSFNAWENVNSDAGEITVASSDNIGGIKIGYTAVGNTYPVQLNSQNKAYVSVPTATNSAYGIVKTAANRTTEITTTQGGTTSGRYYGVELDLYGKAFVNVPWTEYVIGTGLEQTGATGSTQKVAINYDNKTLFAGTEAKDSNSSISDNYDGHPLQLGKDHEWKNTDSNLSNLNNFVDHGVYNIFGEHTRTDDNLPINNTGGGHTFNGRLTVFDSSLPNIGNDIKDCCLTQLLTLSNRVGGDGNIYIRNGSGINKENLSWGNWGKLQTNIEIGLLHINELSDYIDNGIYSGVSVSCNRNVIKYDGAYFVYAQYESNGGSPIYFYSYAFGNNEYENKIIRAYGEDPFTNGGVNLTLINSEGTYISSIDYDDCKFLDSLNNNSNSEIVINLETFVLITINNYVAASSTSTTSKCSQLKYSVDIDGNIKLNQRSGEKIYNDYTSKWYWLFKSWDNVSNTDKIYETSNSESIKPNKFYIWGEKTSLTITLEPEIPEVVNEYMFQFTSGSTPTTLSLPSDIKWVNDELPIIESNYIYQISILNGLGSIMKFKL